MSNFSYNKEKFVERKELYIGRKLIISNFNKMQPLLNISKVWQTIPAGSLKKQEPSKNIHKTN